MLHIVIDQYVSELLYQVWQNENRKESVFSHKLLFTQWVFLIVVWPDGCPDI